MPQPNNSRQRRGSTAAGRQARHRKARERIPPVDPPMSEAFANFGSMIEDAWRLLNSTNEWVRFADAKAGGALAGAGVLAGALASAGLSDRFDAAPTGAVAFGALAGIAALIAAALALYALIPTLRVGEPVSLIYFEHVARKYKKDTDGHADAVRDLLADNDRYFKELAAQVWANSVVARGKFLASGWALTVLGGGVILAGVAAVITVTA